MSFSISCPNCNAVASAPADLAGCYVICSTCKTPFVMSTAMTGDPIAPIPVNELPLFITHIRSRTWFLLVGGLMLAVCTLTMFSCNRMWDADKIVIGTWGKDEAYSWPDFQFNADGSYVGFDLLGKALGTWQTRSKTKTLLVVDVEYTPPGWLGGPVPTVQRETFEITCVNNHCIQVRKFRPNGTQLTLGLYTRFR